MERPGRKHSLCKALLGMVREQPRKHMWQTNYARTPMGERPHVMSGLLGVGTDFRLLEVTWVITDGV